MPVKKKTIQFTFPKTVIFQIITTPDLPMPLLEFLFYCGIQATAANAEIVMHAQRSIV
jgi:hypothetical protein